jgi:hypothetical protein
MSDWVIWRRAAAAYLVASAIGHLTWEAAHVRLYTLWEEGTPAEIRFAVLHCTAGDLLIAALVGLAAWFLGGHPPPAVRTLWRVAGVSIGLGLAYTLVSERLNVDLWRNWAYGPSMPLVPGTSFGLTPVLQWLVVPAGAFVAAHAVLVRYRKLAIERRAGEPMS